MVLNACENEWATDSEERVSPSCRTVTQSPRAMNESTNSTRGQRKYRNISPAYEADVVEQSEDDTKLRSPNSMSTQREDAGDSSEVSPKIEINGSPSVGHKKKGLQKLASGAIANIGSVLRGGANGELESRSEAGAVRSSRNASKVPFNTHDLALDSDPGMQEKVSPPPSSSSQKEGFFQKAWRNRLKVISNAGNALWIPQVWCGVHRANCSMSRYFT